MREQDAIISLRLNKLLLRDAQAYAEEADKSVSDVIRESLISHLQELVQLDIRKELYYNSIKS